MNRLPKSLLLIFLTIGFIWLRSGFGKLSSDAFPAALGETLQKFASKNPYPWYKTFLVKIAIPNSQVFGNLVMWGEVLVATSITLASLYLLFKKPTLPIKAVLGLGLIGGAFLNIIFWLASGWTSPSTDSLNLVMLAVALIGLGSLYKSKA
ncbi:hypothetical protein HYS95_00330 [Candidatus Daviesbacteria bacterium]|nr:hypothetical protein [Candidatus Daviesbacteria bacterium]